MNILTLDNKPFELNVLPDEVDDAMRFAILDNSNPKDPDFFWVPLIFLESFNAPAAVLSINGNEIVMPLDWCVAVGCSESGSDLEILPITSLNERGFEAFLFNPLASFKPDFTPVKVINYYNDVKWYFPKVRNGQLLSVPVQDQDTPLCAYFIKDVTRQTEVVKYGELF